MRMNPPTDKCTHINLTLRGYRHRKTAVFINNQSLRVLPCTYISFDIKAISITTVFPCMLACDFFNKLNMS